MKNQGYYHYRIDSPKNFKEKAFSEIWEEWCGPITKRECPHHPYILDYLLSSIEGYRVSEVSNRDISVAATIIQWLGSNAGQQFLEQVNNRIKELE